MTGPVFDGAGIGDADGPAPLRVVCAIVHHQTPDLLDAAVRTFRAHEPDVPVVVLDNGSDASSDATLDALAALDGVTVERLGANRHHGPAMDHALRTQTADAVLMLDSDTETRAPFVYAMAAALAAGDPATGAPAIAAGQVVTVDRRGFARTRRATIPVPVSWHALVARDPYLRLPPFRHHGLPMLATMAAAQRAGLAVVPFPVEQSVWHKGRGTAGRVGYGLGWRSRLDYLLHRLGL